MENPEKQPKRVHCNFHSDIVFKQTGETSLQGKQQDREIFLQKKDQKAFHEAEGISEEVRICIFHFATKIHRYLLF